VGGAPWRPGFNMEAPAAWAASLDVPWTSGWFAPKVGGADLQGSEPTDRTRGVKPLVTSAVSPSHKP